MSKKFLKSFISLAVFASLFCGSFSYNLIPVKAQSSVDDNILWGELIDDGSGGTSGNLKDAINNTGLGRKDPRAVVAQIISIILGLLGTIAVVLILIGGFKWMTAMGNEDKVDEAKKLLGAGVIGLVIILAAYGIANFVLKVLLNATTSS